MAYVVNCSVTGISIHEWVNWYWILSNTRGTLLKERRDMLVWDEQTQRQHLFQEQLGSVGTMMDGEIPSLLTQFPNVNLQNDLVFPLWEHPLNSHSGEARQGWCWLLSWTECLWSPKLIHWNLSLDPQVTEQGDGVSERRLDYKGGELLNGIEQRPFISAIVWEHSNQLCVNQKSVLSRHQTCRHLVLYLLDSRTRSNNPIVSTPPSSRYFLIATHH